MVYTNGMKYIVPLGNPGSKYQHTRHNVGWLAMDYMIEARAWPHLIEDKKLSGQTTGGRIGGEPVVVLYPDTFMNNSGSAVAKLVQKASVGDLIVLHDDIDLPFGQIKISHSRGGGGNNGVASIIQKLGSKDFVRFRIGIAPTSFWTGKTKRPSGGGPLERFVLKPFSPSERKQLPDLFSTVDAAVAVMIEQGVEVAMNQYN
jgi:PTH1 family peptidyl-tRNA hydrolase